MIIIGGSTPIFIPSPVYPVTSSYGGYGRSLPPGTNRPSWDDAPEWANYMCINIIGGWEWWKDRPKWDWFTGNWSGKHFHEPMLINAHNNTRKARKASLIQRPKDHKVFNKHAGIWKYSDTPDWSTAPAWANYAFIFDSVWYWSDDPPSWSFFGGHWLLYSVKKNMPTRLYADRYDRKQCKESLQERPKNAA